MKVFVLGGYGKMGLPAVKLLAQKQLITRIAIAGRSLERAESAATEVGVKAVPVRVDGTDEQQLDSLSSGYDIIINVAKPEAAISALRVAIRAGMHYCDTASFGDGIQQARELTRDATAAGITAVIANGWTPGFSNLMTVRAVLRLDEVEQLQIGYTDFLNFQKGSELSPRTWLKDAEESLDALNEFRPFLTWWMQRLQEEGIRPILELRNGRWEEVNPVASGVDVPSLPEGTSTSYPYASWEENWFGLPHDLGAVSPAQMWFSPLPPQLHSVLVDQARLVLQEATDSESAVKSFYNTVGSDPRRWLKPPDNLNPYPRLWIRAVGRKGGRAARGTCWFTAPVWDFGGYYLQSVGVAVAALRILRGEVQENGVIIADQAFEPLSFFDEVVSLLPEFPTDDKLTAESFEWLE